MSSGLCDLRIRVLVDQAAEPPAQTAEATARLVLAAAARGPKPGKRPTTGRPAESAASEASPGPQPVRPTPAGDAKRETGVAPTGHPGDTHAPQATEPGDERPVQRVRRQGLQPRTRGLTGQCSPIRCTTT